MPASLQDLLGEVQCIGITWSGQGGDLLRKTSLGHRVTATHSCSTRCDGNISTSTAVINMELAVIRARDKVVAIPADGALEFIKDAVALIQIA